MLRERGTRFDGFLTPNSTAADLSSLPLGAIPSADGPRPREGARPGDLLEIEFVDIVPQRWAFSVIIAGPRVPAATSLTTPFLVFNWTLAGRVGDLNASCRASASPGAAVHGRVRRRPRRASRWKYGARRESRPGAAEGVSRCRPTEWAAVPHLGPGGDTRPCAPCPRARTEATSM